MIGSPEPAIKWLKDGNPIEASNANVTITSTKDGVQKLVVKATTTADVGLYLCEASNEFGIVWSDATLGIRSEDLC